MQHVGHPGWRSPGNTWQWWLVVLAWGKATRCMPGRTTGQGAPGACVTEVAWVWGPPYNVLGKAYAVVVCSQGLPMHPGNCKGYRAMACGAGLGLPRNGCLSIPQGMQRAV